MSKVILLSVLAVGLCGCAAASVRKGIDAAEAGLNAVLSVKDPVFSTARKLVDVSEALKTNVTAGAAATAGTATQ